MLYYRYRPWNDISVKELLYNEIYFSSPDESNDPYEGEKFMEFKSEESKWLKLFTNINNNDYTFGETDKDAKDLISRTVEFFLSKSSWTLADIQKLNEEDLSFLQTDTKRNYRAWFLKLILESKLKSLEQYFASFSRDCRNTIMWSHYADKHKGFCLIFNCEDDKLNQDPQNKKTELYVKEADLSPRVANSQIPESFDLYPIEYLDKTEIIDAFLNNLEKKEALKEVYLQKSKAWEYESESRILLRMDRGVPGESKWSKNQRLFHYDFSQLSGIILGYRMCKNGKEEKEKRDQIKEIIKEKFIRQPARSSFCIFETKLSLQYQQVDLEPVTIITSPAENETEVGETNKKDVDKFRELYEEWSTTNGV